MSDELDLDAIEARRCNVESLISHPSQSDMMRSANLATVCASSDDVPALIAEVRSLRERLAVPVTITDEMRVALGARPEQREALDERTTTTAIVSDLSFDPLDPATEAAMLAESAAPVQPVTDEATAKRVGKWLSILRFDPVEKRLSIMASDRAELADLIESLAAVPVPVVTEPAEANQVDRDARIITTAEERDALPPTTVVRSEAGTIAARHTDGTGRVFGDERSFPWSKLALPLTVLWPSTAALSSSAPAATEDKKR